MGPNDSFLRYIQDVLRALGEIEAAQSTIEALVARTLRDLNPKWTIRGTDRAGRHAQGRRAAGRGPRRAVWANVGVPREALVLPRGARRFRVATYEVEEVVAGLRSRGVRYGAARASCPRRSPTGSWSGWSSTATPDDRVQAAWRAASP